MANKGVSIHEFASFKYTSGVTFSPKGTNLCFVQAQADLEGNKYESFICKRENGKAVQLTAGGRESTYLFLDEDTILFAGDRDEKSGPSIESKYYKISLKGGEASKAYTFPIPVHGLKPLANGDFLMVGSTFPGFEDLYKGDKKLAKEYFDKQKADEDYVIIQENPWWWNGSTYTHGVYDSLFYYDAKKKALKRLTDVNFVVENFAVSPDEKSIYIIGQEKQVHNTFEENNLYRLELETGACKQIFDGCYDLFISGMAAGENYAVLMLHNGSRHINPNPDFYKLDYATDEISLIAVCGDAVGSTVGCDIRRGGGKVLKMVGDTLYFIATMYDGAYLMKLEDGVITKVLEKEGSADCFDVCGDEIVVSALWDMKGTELYSCNAKTGKISQFTHYNDRVLRGKYVAQPERCDARNAGHDVHGFVLKPIDYDPVKKYPVILDIHGGPKTVYGEVYSHEMQYWAGKGYFVIFCNPTGSDGRGDEFADIYGTYGCVDFDDIMAFVDAALKAYPAMDETHIYETGGSYGGFMTNWIVGHTDRFRACVTQRSISNWFSFYGVSDIGIEFVKEQQQNDPWKDPAALWDRSPMKYFDKCTTPTLVLHSLEDYRCPVDQAYQMYTSLIDHGVDSKLVLFKGENHDLSRVGKPAHRVRRLQEITGWFESHS